VDTAAEAESESTPQEPAAQDESESTPQEPTADDSAPEQVAAEKQASEKPAVAPASQRRSRRATRGVTTVAFSAEEEAESAAAPTTSAAGTPALALFQPPDEAKAVRRSRRATAAAGPASGTAGESEPSEESAAESGAESGAETGAGATAGQRRTAQKRTKSGGGSRAKSTGAQQDRGEPVAEAPESSAEPGDEPAPEPGSEVESEPSVEAEETEGAGAEEQGDGSPRRRRRRGGRRRRRSGGQGAPDQAEGLEEGAEGESAGESAGDGAAGGAAGEAGNRASGETEGEAEGEGGSDEESASSRRRRRRRRRAGVAEEMEDLSAEDQGNTVVKTREGRTRGSDEISSVRGSTRIEAKKQRRRDGRDAGRRRAPILTEAEFLARRESVNRVMCVREHGDRTQIAVLEDGILVEHYVNRVESSSMVGNVYLGKVQNVLPSMEAAFVDIGRGRNAVLYAGEVNWDAAGMEGQPKRIELALKSGDPVLVQVTKDPIGHKGARLTSQISLPGRFLVYVPEGSMTGISRKLPDTERSRLKGILRDVVPDGAGVIVRTAAEGATEEQLTDDVNRLASQWADIQKKAKSASPPSLLYGEPDLAIKVVRDIFNEDFGTLLVQGESTWQTLHDYISWVAPDLLAKVQKWVEPTDLYTANRIDEQLAKALDRKVWLPSGGSLVIDRTEAMTVIDVNTGKFTGQGGNLEETVTRNNLEAAEEIVRQLRLRDIGGIVVVDFIDMVLQSNRDLVLRRLVECLGRDRTKHQVAEVTSLGLVQMTRKRIGQGLLEVFSTPCEACGGRGHLVSAEPVEEERPEERGNRRGGGERGNRRGGRKAPVNLGGKQTGKTPPPPKFDEEGHIEHGEHESDSAGPSESESEGAEASGPADAPAELETGAGTSAEQVPGGESESAAQAAPVTEPAAQAEDESAAEADAEAEGETPAEAQDEPAAGVEASPEAATEPGAAPDAEASAEPAVAPEAEAAAELEAVSEAEPADAPEAAASDPESEPSTVLPIVEDGQGEPTGEPATAVDESVAGVDSDRSEAV
jgi:ribonuclease E